MLLRLSVHYKDDYASNEPWKDIDLTIVDDQITKAPYTLVIDKKSIKKYTITVTDKRTGDTVEVKLKNKADNSALIDNDFLVKPDNTAVKITLPHGSTISITKNNKLSSIKLFQLPEGADSFVSIDNKNEIVYDVEVQSDISVRVGASTDDSRMDWNGSAWLFYLTTLHVSTGYVGATSYKTGGGFRFLNITCPKSATIDLANLVFKCSIAKTNDDVNSVIIGEDVDDAATFSTIEDYQARRGTVVGGANNNYITTAHVHWNAIADWVLDTEYTSPDIKTIIAEITTRAGWVSGNDMVLWWDDHDGLSTAADATVRNAHAYDISTTEAPLLTIDYTEAYIPPRGYYPNILAH